MAEVVVAREDEVPPGRAIRVWVNDEPVGIYNIGGELFAIGDVCTHEDFSLSDGELIEDHEVECALHGSRFDLRTGLALCLPATGAVPTYKVWVDNGDIKVEVAGIGDQATSGRTGATRRWNRRDRSAVALRLPQSPAPDWAARPRARWYGHPRRRNAGGWVRSRGGARRCAAPGRVHTR